MTIVEAILEITGLLCFLGAHKVLRKMGNDLDILTIQLFIIHALLLSIAGIGLMILARTYS